MLERFGFTTAWQCETDRHARRVLTAHWPGVPNYGDITTIGATAGGLALFDWSDVEPVDVVCAGFPCPPVSSAGRRLGADDERWLWPDVARAVRDLRPGLVFLENVASLLSFPVEFGQVVGDLAALGFDAEWTVLRACDVGAPHRRARLFLVATDSRRGELQRRRDARFVGGAPGPAEGSRPERERDGDAAGNRRETPSDADRQRREGTVPEPSRDCRRNDPASPDPESVGGSYEPDGRARQDEPVVAVARPPFERDFAGDDPAGGPAGRDVASVVAWGVYEQAIRRWESIHGCAAPNPVDRLGRLNPALPEWMMGYPPGWITDVPISRAAQIWCAGNGIVPLAAETAWEFLTGRLFA